ncbi:hypothetical protein ACH5RR_032357 [Cinchona calisaya]|uniref:Uncharacterized protein n=1 Tax=Cinchona calisaya TaxID=153742 RepID=A0ABD2YHV8_9GENT
MGGKLIQWISKDSTGTKKDLQPKNAIIGSDCPSSSGVSVVKKLLDTTHSQPQTKAVEIWDDQEAVPSSSSLAATVSPTTATRPHLPHLLPLAPLLNNLAVNVQSVSSEVILELNDFYDELMDDHHRQFQKVKKCSLVEKDIPNSLSDSDLVDCFNCPRPVVMGILHNFLESLDAKLSKDPDNSQPNELPMPSKV